MFLKYQIFLLIILLLSFLIALLSYIFSSSNLYLEKLTTYECGFVPYNDSRSKTQIFYYLIALLFLIWDLETIILYPFIKINIYNSKLNLFIFLDFYFELIIGFVYMWMLNIFSWFSINSILLNTEN